MAAETDNRPAYHLLKPRERKFVTKYVASGNALQSAHAAGYSKKSTAVGHDLLHRPLVRRAIEDIKRDLARMGVLETAQIIDEYKTIAFLRPEELKGEPTYDHKLRALDALARTEGLFKDSLEVKGNVTLSMLVKASYEREKVVEATVTEVPELPAPA